jgi:hypothetical protein
MRDRTRSRNYSASRDEFRREHERHREWGLAQRHARKLRRIREGSLPSSATTPDAPTVRAPNPHQTRPPDPTSGESSQRPRDPTSGESSQRPRDPAAGQTARPGPASTGERPHDEAPPNHTSRPDRDTAQPQRSHDDRSSNETSQPDHTTTQSRNPRDARAPDETLASKSASPEGSHRPRDDPNAQCQVRPRPAAQSHHRLTGSPGTNSHAGSGPCDGAGGPPDQLQPSADRHHGATGSCRTSPPGAAGPSIAESTTPILQPADDGAPPNRVDRRREPPNAVCSTRTVTRDRTAPSEVPDPATVDTTSHTPTASSDIALGGKRSRSGPVAHVIACGTERLENQLRLRRKYPAPTSYNKALQNSERDGERAPPVNRHARKFI